MDRPGVGEIARGDDPPRGEEPDGPEAEGDGEPDTLMVRPTCLPPLPLWDGDVGDTGSDPEVSGAWLTAAGPTIAAAAAGEPL